MLVVEGHKAPPKKKKKKKKGNFLDLPQSLRFLEFSGILFPELPKLLLSLSNFWLFDIPPSRIHFTRFGDRSPLRLENTFSI
jgi:hypothetical protein